MMMQQILPLLALLLILVPEATAQNGLCRPKKPKCNKQQCCGKCCQGSCYRPAQLPGIRTQGQLIQVNTTIPPERYAPVDKEQEILLRLQTTTAAPEVDEPKGCTFEDEYFRHRDLFKRSRCELCLCQDGDLVCEEVVCKRIESCPEGMYLGREHKYECCEKCLPL